MTPRLTAVCTASQIHLFWPIVEPPATLLIHSGFNTDFIIEISVMECYQRMAEFGTAAGPMIDKFALNHIARADQQFLYRGTPRRLPEDARYRLAAFLGIDQIQLADALFAKTPSTGDTLITGASPNRHRQFALQFLDLSASAGGGAEADIASETTSDPDNQWIFTRHWLARLGGADSRQVCG